MAASGLKMTPEEARRLEEAMRKPEFQQLLEEYAREIADPKRRAEYEEYIRQAEAGAPLPPGMKLVKPTPWFCLKTRAARALVSQVPETGVQDQSKDKVFINVCHATEVAAASADSDAVDLRAEKSRGVDATGNPGRGSHWRIPYILTPLRPCKDNSGRDSQVCDVVFSSETKKRSEANLRFRALVEQTAVEAVAEKWQRRLDASATVLLHSVKFKGEEPPAITVHTDIAQPSSSATAPSLAPAPAPARPAGQVKVRTPDLEPEPAPVSASQARPKIEALPDGPAQPKYRLVERGEQVAVKGFEFEAREEPIGARRPAELMAKIELPDEKDLSAVDVQVEPRTLRLTTTHNRYALTVGLPYAVDESRVSAKFTRKTGLLTVTMPVRPLTAEEVAQLRVARVGAREDKADEKEEASAHVTEQEGAKAETATNAEKGSEKNEVAQVQTPTQGPESSLRIDESDAKRDRGDSGGGPDMIPPPLSLPESAAPSEKPPAIAPDSPAASPASTPSRRARNAKKRPPFSFHEKSDMMVLLVAEKSILASSLRVDVAAERLTVRYSTQFDAKKEQELDLVLAGRVDPAQSRWELGPKNLVVQLKKEGGEMWGVLERDGLPPRSPKKSPLTSPARPAPLMRSTSDASSASGGSDGRTSPNKRVSWSNELERITVLESKNAIRRRISQQTGRESPTAKPLSSPVAMGSPLKSALRNSPAGPQPALPPPLAPHRAATLLDVALQRSYEAPVAERDATRRSASVTTQLGAATLAHPEVLKLE